MTFSGTCQIEYKRTLIGNEWKYALRSQIHVSEKLKEGDDHVALRLLRGERKEGGKVNARHERRKCGEGIEK